MKYINKKLTIEKVSIQNIAKNKTKAEKECEARHYKEILVYYRKLKSSNLKKAKKIANQRIKNASFYDKNLSKIKGIKIPPRIKNYKIV